MHLMMWLALADCFMVFLELLWNGTKYEVWSTTSPKLKVIVTTVSLQVKFTVGDSSHANWKGQVQELLWNQVSYDSFAQRLQNIYLLQTRCKDIDNIKDVEKLSTHARTQLNRPFKRNIKVKVSTNKQIIQKSEKTVHLRGCGQIILSRPWQILGLLYNHRQN